jgi:hypothetical protein
MQMTPVRKGPSEQLGVPGQAMECPGELRLVYGGLGQWTGPMPPRRLPRMHARRQIGRPSSCWPARGRAWCIYRGGVTAPQPSADGAARRQWAPRGAHCHSPATASYAVSNREHSVLVAGY